ncbi:MAG: TerB family tellurite resistance protein [Pseudomonadota bacterium]
MHVIIGFLSSIVTILWLLHRLAEMGIDLGGLNPWSWKRRRKFRAAYEANPIFRLDDPLEATAVLMVAVAKADGDMSGAERRELLDAFTERFHLSNSDAAALLTASTHMLGNGDAVRDSLESVLQPSVDKFSPTQATSAVELLEQVAAVDGAASDAQQALIERARTTLAGHVSSTPATWS